MKTAFPINLIPAPPCLPCRGQTLTVLHLQRHNSALFLLPATERVNLSKLNLLSYNIRWSLRDSPSRCTSSVYCHYTNVPKLTRSLFIYVKTLSVALLLGVSAGAHGLSWPHHHPSLSFPLGFIWAAREGAREEEMRGEERMKSEGGIARPAVIPVHTYQSVCNPSWWCVSVCACVARKTKGRDIHTQTG